MDDMNFFAVRRSAEGASDTEFDNLSFAFEGQSAAGYRTRKFISSRPAASLALAALLLFACAVLPDAARAHPDSRRKQAVTAARETETHLPKEALPRLLDTLTFDAPDSEQAYGLTAKDSDEIAGGLGLSARRLLPRKPASFEGGTLAFTMKTDPEKPNYVTVRLWGSDVSQNRLVLFCEGKQIGYHHLGDVDILDFGTDSDAPGYNGRFFIPPRRFPAV